MGAELAGLNVKTVSLESPITSLSGGNQQKIVMARSLLAQPKILLADEPTQGVDVGARAEIYRILREVSSNGVPVIVASSDAKELEGLCDRVIVLSRGHVVATLAGDEVTEERMIRAAVESTTLTRAEESRSKRRVSPAWRRRLEGDYAPVLILASVMLCLGAYIYSQNDRYLLAFNVSSVMLLVSALGFIAMGQTVALMTGGIDLSVGPLAGFLVVVGSFFLTDEDSGTSFVVGLVLMAVLAAVVGVVNGSLIRFGKFTAVAATLATYIALQGFSFLLRDRPDGLISRDVTDLITTKIGDTIPVAFIVLVAITLGDGVCTPIQPLGTPDPGCRVRRGVGTPTRGAHHEDGRPRLHVVSLFTFLGALLLLAQLGIGDPAQGTSYTLSQHHRRRARRHQPAGRPRHVRRHPARCRADRPAPQRHHVPEPDPDLAVHLPGRSHRDRRPGLQPGARYRTQSHGRRPLTRAGTPRTPSRSKGHRRASSALLRKTRHPRGGDRHP